MIKNKCYWEGFHDGAENERKKCIEVFKQKIERLAKVKGIGPKTYAKIIQSINEPLEVEK